MLKCCFLPLSLRSSCQNIFMRDHLKTFSSHFKALLWGTISKHFLAILEHFFYEGPSQNVSWYLKADAKTFFKGTFSKSLLPPFFMQKLMPEDFFVFLCSFQISNICFWSFVASRYLFQRWGREASQNLQNKNFVSLRQRKKIVYSEIDSTKVEISLGKDETSTVLAVWCKHVMSEHK